MRLLTSVSATLILLATAVVGGPTALRKVEKYAGKVKTGSYIVTLKSGVDKTSLVSELGDAVTHEWHPSLLNGFAGEFDTDSLNEIRAHSDVESITEDGYASIDATETTETEYDAPWGLARLNSDTALSVQNSSFLNYTYSWDTAYGGEGVDIYVIDTGIFVEHEDFGGRATWGAAFGGNDMVDGHGHGTHVAGTAGGTRFGVAKNVKLIAVKVLDDDGYGSWSDIISGMNFALTSAQASGRPSIATISIGGIAQTSVDNAVAALTAGGLHVTVSAGNSATDISKYSPARAPTVNTIGATGVADAFADYNNFGPELDLLAPGSGVTSAWIGNTTAINRIGGTSMATPHVAGLIAYIISNEGDRSPADMKTYLKEISLSGVITSVPVNTTSAFIRLPY